MHVSLTTTKKMKGPRTFISAFPMLRQFRTPIVRFERPYDATVPAKVLRKKSISGGNYLLTGVYRMLRNE